MNNLVRAVFSGRNIINFTECKRFAGHSKWANIRHVKAEKDGQKQQVMQQLTRQMKIAIAEGKSAKPDDNPKLAKLIDQAKKKNLPMATIRNLLEREQKAKTRTESLLVESRGPGGSIFLFHLLTDNVAHTRNNINYQLKRVKFSRNEIPNQSFFEQKGMVITEVDNFDLDKATEDAIETGAEDAEKYSYENTEYFQFTCHPAEVQTVRTKLEEKNYKIIQADVEFTPRATVSLNEDQLNAVKTLYNRLSGMDEIVGIYSNIEEMQ